MTYAIADATPQEREEGGVVGPVAVEGVVEAAAAVAVVGH